MKHLTEGESGVPNMWGFLWAGASSWSTGSAKSETQRCSQMLMRSGEDGRDKSGSETHGYVQDAHSPCPFGHAADSQIHKTLTEDRTRLS